MDERLASLPAQLQRCGPWRALQPLQGDASTRRYARLLGSGSSTAIAAVYPPGSATTLARDLEVRQWLERVGLRVPAVLATDLEAGWVVLEDFGSADAAAALAAITSEHRAAVLDRLLDPLVTLANLDPSVFPGWSPTLGRDRLRWELAGFELWYHRARCDRVPPPATVGWLDRLADECAAAPYRVCHRDYHLNNLFLLADGTVGVIDFQDVLLGPEAYDVVSLLGERDSQTLLTPEQRRHLLQEWALRTSANEGWQRRAAAVSVQRRLKVLGTFARLEAAGRASYSAWLRQLEVPTAEAIAALDGPQELVDLLLHSSRQGGPYVR